MLQAFQVFDENGDGTISVEGLRHFMLKVADDCTIDEVNEFIETVDTNGDGVINYEGKKKQLVFMDTRLERFINVVFRFFFPY